MFTSSWANPQNQQQQQPNNAFGQPSVFGTPANNTFGSTSAFSQPQQQQQPQVNPMFGNITATPSTSSNTGFGTFTNNSNTGGTFGIKPATGFGAFASGSGTFGGSSTSTFGQPATATSVFGQPATTSTTSAFGTSNPLFGGSKFGSTEATAAASIPVVTTGTSNPPFNITNDKDGALTLQYHSISSMPAYIGYSFEELRVQDYAQNRKTGASGAFGQPLFGNTQAPSTNAFGQPQQPNNPVFGSTSTNPTGFNAFTPNTNQPANTNTNPLFGGTTNAFAQPQQQQQPSAFNAFNQPQQPQQPSNVFGGSAATSTFGNTANKSAFTPFSGGGGNAFSAFANPQQQPAQPPSVFGNPQPANNQSPFNAFANSNKPSIFGTPTTNAQPAPSPFAALANTQQPQQNQQQPQQPLFGGGNLFGQQQNQQPQQQGAQQNPLFGGGQTTTPSIFGNTNPGTNLFGNNQQGQLQQQPATNNFFNAFNKPTQPSPNPLFGNQSQTISNQTQQNPFLSGQTQNNPLFGNKTNAPLLGNSFSGSQGMSTTFSASAGMPGAQGTMTASITQPIGENLPIFSMLPPGPRILGDQNSPKKSAGLLLDMPTRSPAPRAIGYTPANSKLRGFASSPISSSTNYGSNVLLASGKPGVLTLNKLDLSSSSVGPDLLRSGSPALGSGARQSFKKVVMDKKVDPGEVFVRTDSGAKQNGKITFTPWLSMKSREQDANTVNPSGPDSSTPIVKPQPRRNSNRYTVPNSKEGPPVEEEHVTSTEPVHGDYWIKPDLATLKKVGYDQLSSYEGLIVGRKGYGQVEFLEPVDLTGLPKLGALLGDVVKLEDKECAVYADSEEVDKPPPGSGLNVKAKLSLERCWAVDKAHRDAIKDPNHPSAIKHLKKLKVMKDTHFENFDIEKGTWTFIVDHF